MRTFIILCTFCFSLQAQQHTSAHELARHERAFAAAADSAGIRSSFLAFLDEHCIMFNPHPLNGMELYRNRPESKAHLSWYPAFVEVASSGEMGLSTGPWQYRAAKGDTPAAYGYYISVWKRRQDGVWKVVFDNGIGYPKNVHRQEPETFRMITQQSPSAGPLQTSHGMMDAERAFRKEWSKNGAAAAVERFGDSDVRVYRNDAFPAVERKNAAALVRQKESGMTFTASDSVIAASGDLGYVYGIAVSPVKDSASYVRVWRYRSGWKLAADVLDPFRKQ
ncbi:MAG: hypothetical protein HUU02_13595 [Bacteroidetes bacterium]|nr:hypothetical protein [Bacteroidota bacterium]